MDKRENILRAVRFERPEYVPMVFHINESCWNYYPAGALEELRESHPFLFGGEKEDKGRTELDYKAPERVGGPFTDGWGCLWETMMDGIVGTVTKHSLETWNDFEGFKPPDWRVDSGKGPIDWEEAAAQIDKTKRGGKLAMGGLRHGHTFQTLTDIRGYENLLFDMFDEEPGLGKLIAMVEEFNLAIVNKFIELGAEWMNYPEDLGMQTGPMIGPEMFRKYIKPVYKRLMEPARKSECVVHMHCDGHIRDLAEDLIECGVEVLNIQDLVNGIDWIRENLVGRVCIDLDIDRQEITVHGTPQQIDALVREEVEKLGAKDGGLMMIYGLYPPTPLGNAKAVMDAMERYADFWSQE